MDPDGPRWTQMDPDGHRGLVAVSCRVLPCLAVSCCVLLFLLFCCSVVLLFCCSCCCCSCCVLCVLLLPLPPGCSCRVPRGRRRVFRDNGRARRVWRTADDGSVPRASAEATAGMCSQTSATLASGCH